MSSFKNHRYQEGVVKDDFDKRTLFSIENVKLLQLLLMCLKKEQKYLQREILF